MGRRGFGLYRSAVGIDRAEMRPPPMGGGVRPKERYVSVRSR